MEESNLPPNCSFATVAIHSGQNPGNCLCDGVIPPITLSTPYRQIAPGENKGYIYSRTGNPTRRVLEETIENLEGGKYGLVFSSGLGALSAIVNCLKSGDHVVCGDDIYGGTSNRLRDVAEKYGIETTYVCLTDAEKFKASLRSNTKMVWLESPTNPTLKVTDIKKISEIAHSKGDIIVVVDNTFLTCYFQCPLELGADIVMYSLTKYMNGHSDVIMGAAITNRDDLHKSLRFLQNSLGGVPSPFDCYMVKRGLKTLPIRMKQHMYNSMKVAQFLEKHSLIEKVIHPGLPSHPQYELSKRQSRGFSGMLSFYIGRNKNKVAGVKESVKFLQSLKIIAYAGSLGGCESLIVLPFTMSHASVPLEQRKALGITETFLRMSVGLEDADDLCKDLDQALQCAFED